MNVKRSLAWMSLAQGAAFAVQFGGSVVLARHLTPHDMGIYALAAGIVGALALLQAFGLQNLVVREHMLTREVEQSAFSINTIIAVGLSLLIIVASYFGEAVLGEPGVRQVLMVLALVPLLGAFEFLPVANIERRGGFKVIALVSLGCSFVSAVITIVLALRGHTFMSIAYAQLAASVTSAVVYGVVGRRYLQFGMSFSAWRRVTHHGFQMMAVYGITAVAKRLADLFLGKLLGLSALGLYTRASSLNELIWNNVHLAAGRVVFVDFATLHREGHSLRQRYLKITDIVTCVLWPAFAGFAILAGPLIRAVYGEPWVPAAAPLAWLSLASIVLVSITMTWELFVATGRLADQTRIEFLRAGVGLAIFVLACTVSLEAAAGARVAEAVFAVLLYRPHLNRMTDTRGRDFLPIYGRNALTTLLAVAPAALLMLYHGGSVNVPMLQVGASCLLGVACWYGGLVALGHRLVPEIHALLRRLKR